LNSNLKKLLYSIIDGRSTSVAEPLAESALKANSKLPSSIQIVLLVSLLNGLLEGYNVPFRITLVTIPKTQKVAISSDPGGTSVLPWFERDDDGLS